MFFSIIVVFDRLSTVFTHAFFTYASPTSLLPRDVIVAFVQRGIIFFFFFGYFRIVIRVIKKNKFHLSFCGHTIAYRHVRRLYTIYTIVRLILFENLISMRYPKMSHILGLKYFRSSIVKIPLLNIFLYFYSLGDSHGIYFFYKIFFLLLTTISCDINDLPKSIMVESRLETLYDVRKDRSLSYNSKIRLYKKYFHEL